MIRPLENLGDLCRERQARSLILHRRQGQAAWVAVPLPIWARSLFLSFLSRLQGADDQQKHKCQHDDANKKETQRLAPGTKVIVVFAPVPQVGIIWVGRYRTYWRGHRPSVGSTRTGRSAPCRSRRRVATKPSGTDTGWAYRCTRTRRTGPLGRGFGVRVAHDAHTWHHVSMDATLVLGQQGRVVIPAGVRAALGLAPGDRLHLHLVGQRLVLERQQDAVDELRGLASNIPKTRSLVDELLAERRVAATAE